MTEIMEILRVIIESCGSLVIILIGGVVAWGIIYCLRKIGINVSTDEYTTIINIVKQVIKYLNPNFISKLMGKKNDKMDLSWAEQQIKKLGQM